MNIRELVDRFNHGAKAAGAEAREYAERFDSKLAELNDTVQAQRENYEVKYVYLFLDKPVTLTITVLR